MDRPHPLPSLPALARRSAAALAALAWISPPAGAQSDGACAKPGMDVVPGTHPYGPVDFDDGTDDWINVQTHVPLGFEFSVAGLDHEASLPLAPLFATLTSYAFAKSALPIALGPCASLALPLTSPLVVVPSATLEVGAEIEDVLFFDGFDLWFQTASVDLLSGELATSDPARVRFQRGPYLADPAADQDFSCYYFGNYTWNLGDGVGSVAGRVYWPNSCDGTGAPSGVFPLVLIAHGDGHSYLDYGYLGRHLALNGFIVASIDAGQGLSNVERAKRIRTYLSFLRYSWTYKNQVANNIALLGHSRGGEAVLTAARKLVLDWGYDHDINALLSLAPTDSDQDGGTEGLESLDASDCPALLVMYGSLDEDVSGYCTEGSDPFCGINPTAPLGTGFSLYDRAGGEYSTEAVFALDDAVTKSMLFVERADHNRWRDPCTNPGFGLPSLTPLSCDEHHELLEAYANAFFRWQLRGQSAYEPYFTGGWLPDVAREQDIRVLTQFSQGQGRRVIDNFQAGVWNQATLGTITHDPQVVVVKKGTLFDYGNHTIPHDTQGMILRWSTNPFVIEPWIRWTIPAGGGLFVADYRDFSGFQALSLRAGQIDDAASNPAGAPQNFFVRLRDGDGVWSPKVWVDAFTDLSYPHQAQVSLGFGSLKKTPKSSLRTARIPLEYFSGIDLDEVVDVELVFGDNAHLQGEIVIDSLELVP
jgi:hypothetical protein